MTHRYEDLIQLFYDCFYEQYNTKLLLGGDEPLYLPADNIRPYHSLFFAHGFFSSALHECAHWLIAGEARRKQVDFGYWYMPDGRNASEQAAFFAMEAKPQAMEWILSKAAGFCFNVSVDNLSGAPTDTDVFKTAVNQEVIAYCEKGLSARASAFRAALCNFYGTPIRLDAADFQLT